MTADTFDAVVVGAGIVGAASAYYLATAGLRVAVVERGTPSAGTTGEGEGNILVSDKAPGPELDLALLSNRLWRALPEECTVPAELEHKGGLVVATDDAQAVGLASFAARQREAGLSVEDVDAGGAADLEPHLTPRVASGAWYPDDLQVQPMLATGELLSAAHRAGAVLRFREEVTGMLEEKGRSSGVVTVSGRISSPVVVNCAGAWAGEVAQLVGSCVPVQPRRGFIVVTEAIPRLIRHKVYTADYVANVESDQEGLETSTVVEGTRSGTVLIGASRERVGFDRASSWSVVGTLAAGAVRLFPVLGSVRAIRFYRGFRPYCPDHLPVIGPDHRLQGLYHACGHEGAGIGLAPATGHLIAQAVLGQAGSVSMAPFAPSRFAGSGC